MEAFTINGLGFLWSQMVNTYWKEGNFRLYLTGIQLSDKKLVQLYYARISDLNAEFKDNKKKTQIKRISYKAFQDI